MKRCIGLLVALVILVGCSTLNTADALTGMWVSGPTKTPMPTKTPQAWTITRTAEALPRTATPIPTVAAVTPTPTPVDGPTATVAPATATPSASSTPTASPTSRPVTATLAPATSTPTRDAPAPLIVGSPSFVQDIREGLALMARVSPSDADIVRQWVGEIKQSYRNYSTSGSRTIEISTDSASFSVEYAGAIVLHEAVHVRASYTGQVPVWGCKGEERSLRAQAAYLRKAHDEYLAKWSESLIGSWC